MRATSVGPDLSRSIVRIIEKTGAARDAATAADEPEVETESDEHIPRTTGCRRQGATSVRVAS